MPANGDVTKLQNFVIFLSLFHETNARWPGPGQRHERLIVGCAKCVLAASVSLTHVILNICHSRCTLLRCLPIQFLLFPFFYFLNYFFYFLFFSFIYSISFFLPSIPDASETFGLSTDEYEVEGIFGQVFFFLNDPTSITPYVESETVKFLHTISSFL